MEVHPILGCAEIAAKVTPIAKECVKIAVIINKFKESFNKMRLRKILTFLSIITIILSTFTGCQVTDTKSNSTSTTITTTHESVNTYSRSSNDSTRKTSTSKSGCQYKYNDGSICGATTKNGSTLCDKHFKELDDTYKSLESQWNEWEELQ